MGLNYEYDEKGTIVRRNFTEGPCHHGRERVLTKVCTACFAEFRKLLQDQDEKIKELGKSYDVANTVVGQMRLEIMSLKKELYNIYEEQEKS